MNIDPECQWRRENYYWLIISKIKLYTETPVNMGVTCQPESVGT